MQIIDVPVFNEDGSVQFTQKVSPEQSRELLTFALNFFMANGMMHVVEKVTAQNTPQELND